MLSRVSPSRIAFGGLFDVKTHYLLTHSTRDGTRSSHEGSPQTPVYSPASCCLPRNVLVSSSPISIVRRKYYLLSQIVRGFSRGFSTRELMSCSLLRQSPSSDESTSSSHKWYHLPYTRLPGPRTAFLSSLGSPVQLSVLRRAARSRYNVSVFLRAVRCSSPSSSRLPTPRTACPSSLGLPGPRYCSRSPFFVLLRAARFLYSFSVLLGAARSLDSFSARDRSLGYVLYLVAEGEPL